LYPAVVFHGIILARPDDRSDGRRSPFISRNPMQQKNINLAEESEKQQQSGISTINKIFNNQYSINQCSNKFSLRNEVLPSNQRPTANDQRSTKYSIINIQ
jgi:hypothetical protein